jgi:transcriptional regulator with XRE-family HTH domain
MGLAESLRYNLLARREQLRLSQEQVADRATRRTGITVYRTDVSRWENGPRRPGLKKIEALAAALNCTAAELMTERWELPDLPEGF